MKARLTCLVIFALAAALLMTPAAYAAEDGLFSSAQAEQASPVWVRIIPEALDPDVTQLFVVAGLGMDKTTATVSLHERDADGSWKQVFSSPGFVGKYGLVLDSERREGCGRTPVGTYRFNKAFGIAEDPGCAIPYVQVDENTYWSGDPDRQYNQMVDIREVPDLVMDDSEHIVDYPYEYQYCLNISFNEDGTPGRGSAIFLHCFGVVKPYTGGCVALPENIMKLVMQRVQPDCVVVIDTLEHLSGSAYIGSGFTADAGESALYSERDLDEAMAAVWTEFRGWEGCELHAVRYAGDEANSEENLAWLNSLSEGANYTQAAELLTDFHSPIEGGPSAWEPDTEYTDYQWWLARSEGGGWELVSWGY